MNSAERTKEIGLFNNNWLRPDDQSTSAPAAYLNATYWAAIIDIYRPFMQLGLDGVELRKTVLQTATQALVRSLKAYLDLERWPAVLSIESIVRR